MEIENNNPTNIEGIAEQKTHDIPNNEQLNVELILKQNAELLKKNAENEARLAEIFKKEEEVKKQKAIKDAQELEYYRQKERESLQIQKQNIASNGNALLNSSYIKEEKSNTFQDLVNKYNNDRSYNNSSRLGSAELKFIKESVNLITKR